MSAEAEERERRLHEAHFFSEWTQVFTNTRLCKAILDRITDRAHIIETGTDSYRFHRTMERCQICTLLLRYARNRCEPCELGRSIRRRISAGSPAIAQPLDGGGLRGGR